MKIRQHTLACRAYDCIQARQDQADYATYRSRALGLPVFILNNGLAQTTGFLLAKQEDTLLDDLARCLGHASGRVLHQESITCDRLRYQQLTRDSLTAAAWLRRYLQALPETSRHDQTSNEASQP